MPTPPTLATLEYLAEVAKDWVVAAFAAAVDGDFVLAPHRFELDGATVLRSKVTRRSREAVDPLAVRSRSRRSTAWARSDTLTVLHDAPSGPVAYEQEIVEILVVVDDAVIAQAAHVVRTVDLPPCLGGFWSVT